MVPTPDIDKPEILREVETVFLDYERALNENDVEALNRLFWNDPRTLRFGVAENLYGHRAIADFRKGRRPPGVRQLGRTVLTTIGDDCASASAEFAFPDDDRIGRQTQIWIRTPKGWKILAAHVSFISKGTSQT